MQTSLARRQRHRRMNGGRRSSGGGSVKTVAIALPLFLFGTLLSVGLLGFVGVVGAYTAYSNNLEDPQSIFADLSFDQQTKLYDRSGDIELARLGDFKRELVTFADIPPELVDATTAIEDKSFWENAGFDPIGIISAGLDTLRGNERGASTITQQIVRARLLRPEDFEGSVYERKIREIIQSVRLTQSLPPGEAGKQQIITAYLNNNFYGNQSYGVEAAARSYFGKSVGELTLAQMAILAGIPQSPTKFDLVRNAEVSCSIDVEDPTACPADKVLITVPPDSEVVQRRDRILELMKTRSVLSASRHTTEDYDRAMQEPVVLVPQVTQSWKAAHFVWQVQHALGEIICGPESADDCPEIATAGYTVKTTLDWDKQVSVEHWIAAAARAPNSKDPDAMLKSLGIPKADWAWIKELHGRNIHNAAAAVEDARTGQILAYTGSAGYGVAGSEQLQPQFDVLSDGYRQPGSAIKPIDYAVGIDDHTMTASTMFMDVVTNFGSKAAPYTPKQADDAERGPVRLRSALQFSLNIPAIKAGFINGLDHQFNRTKDFGLTYLNSAVPVVSESIGTLETRPIDMLGAYSVLANGGVRMPQQMILEVRDSNGAVVWPVAGDAPTGERVVSPQTSWIMGDILKGNTDSKVNPYWAKWAIVQDKVRREAAYKTGTTEDNRDVAAYGYLAPPDDPSAPQLVVGVWMGNSDNTPNDGKLSLDTSAPVWSRIMTSISDGMPLAKFDSSRPDGLVEAKVDAFSGLKPGPFSSKLVTEWFIANTVPTQVDDTKTAVEIDSATGDLWQDGCTGPKVTKGVMNLSKVESGFPAWRPYTANWAARAARGIGTVGGPERTRVTVFYNTAFAPFGRTWGTGFAPSATCEPLPVVDPCDPAASQFPQASVDPFATPPPDCPSIEPSPTPTSSRTPRPEPSPKPTKAPKPSPSPH